MFPNADTLFGLNTPEKQAQPREASRDRTGACAEVDRRTTYRVEISMPGRSLLAQRRRDSHACREARASVPPAV
jgi:hypothetical protein